MISAVYKYAFIHSFIHSFIQKWTKEEIPLKESDVVLISEDNIPRGKWKVEKSVDTFPGKDRRIRTVRVQTKRGMINSPVQKLHLLEQ